MNRSRAFIPVEFFLISIFLVSHASGAITVTSPNGGEVWATGSTQTVTWVSADGGNVIITLYKGGNYVRTVSTVNTPNNGSFSWKIWEQETVGSDYRIRVASATNPASYDESNADFALVAGFITAVSVCSTPEAGKTCNITWSSNLGGSVRIDLYRTGWIFTIADNVPNDGTYPWAIGASQFLSHDYSIKIYHKTSNFYGTSNQFSITGTRYVQILSPNGGESWEQGSAHNISWTSNFFSSVALELRKGGIIQTVPGIGVATPLANTGTWSWIVPYALPAGIDYRMRIYDAQDYVARDDSDANFTIAPKIGLRFTSPAGGEAWLAGASHTITWDSNLGGNLKIDLFSGATLFSTLVSSTPDNGSFNWSIPTDHILGTYHLRITSLTNPSLFYDSTDFQVSGTPFVKVTSPNGGEKWGAGSKHNITWSSNLGGTVQIWLYNGANYYGTITSSTPNTGNYEWTLNSNLGSTTFKVCVWYSNSVSDLSDAYFTIAGIHVTSPNGGESLLANSPGNITWTRTSGVGANVKIELYKGGVFERTLVSSTPSAGGSYAWSNYTIPSVGSNYRIRIADAADDTIYDFSDADFTLLGVAITSPASREVWQAGTAHNITWQTNIAGNVDIKLSLLNKDQWLAQNTPGTGSFPWSIPATQILSIHYQVEVLPVSNPAATSNKLQFTIAGTPNVTVQLPNGGETWTVGHDQTVTWQSNLDGDVSINLFDGANYVVGAGTGWIPNTGSYVWSLPRGLPPSSNNKVEVYARSADHNVEMTDRSDAPFTLKSLKLTNYRYNAYMYQGKTATFKWDSNLGGNVKIELYRGDVLTTSVTAGVPNNGSFDWSVPPGQPAGTDYKVRITSLSDAAVWDMSINNNTVAAAPSLVVLSPNGGESWAADSTHDITWSTNAIENLRLDLYKGGIFSRTLFPSHPSSANKYPWLILLDIVPGNDYRIRISIAENPSVFDESNANFSITAVPPAIKVLSPNGYEKLQAGTTQKITWTTNLGGNVKIELMKGGVLNATISSSAPNNLSFGWAIPADQPSGDDFRVKITSLSDPSVSDSSDNDFRIKPVPYITVGTPNGGESWPAGTTHDIAWDSNVWPDYINVWITLLKGGKWVADLAGLYGTDPRLTPWSWTVPAGLTPGTDYRIEVRTRYSEAADMSDGDFTITAPAYITVTSPNGGETWQAGTVKSITWDSNAGGNVMIDLLKNGNLDSTISGSTSNNGTFLWSLPITQASAADYTVRISSLQYSNISDVSNAVFTISGYKIFLPLIVRP